MSGSIPWHPLPKPSRRAPGMFETGHLRVQPPDRQELQNDMRRRTSFARSSCAHIMAIMAAALQQADLSLVPSRILEQKVLFLKDCVGSDVEAGTLILHDFA